MTGESARGDERNDAPARRAPRARGESADRLSHLIPAASFFYLVYLYGWTLNVGPRADWASPRTLFLVFKIEMFALMALGFVFIFGTLMFERWRGRAFVAVLAAAMLYAAHHLGGWTGVWMLAWLGAMQVIAARSHLLGLVQVGLWHIGGYVYVVLLVRLFTTARDFDGLTPDNILKPALAYFITRGVLELVQVFLPARSTTPRDG